MSIRAPLDGRDSRIIPGSDERGVSPVIATLLLVAIAVLLTVAVTYTVQQLRQEKAEVTPSVSFQKVEQTDRILVTAAGSGADWSRISVRLQGCTQAAADGLLRLGSAAPYQNDAATSTGAPLNEAASGTTCGTGLTVAAASALAPVHANDFLAFCGTPSGVRLTDVALAVIDSAANTVLATLTFSAVLDC